MNNKYLISVFLLFFLVKTYSQNLILEDLTRLSNLSLAEFQEYMYEERFLFYQADKDARTKTDTISFINKENVKVSFVVSKKEKTVLVENINEDYFQKLNHDLKQADFVLIDTQPISNHILEKKYLDKTTEKIIELSTVSNANLSNSYANTYRIKIIKVSNYLYRKYLAQIKNKKDL